MTPIDSKSLVFDWNSQSIVPGALERRLQQRQEIVINDETNRDGLQGHVAQWPSANDLLTCLDYMEGLGVGRFDAGLPVKDSFIDLIRTQLLYLKERRYELAPNVACRTVIADIQPVIRLQDEFGAPVEVMAFIASSEIRQATEEWSLEKMVGLVGAAIEFGASNGLTMCSVTEDTSRAKPETIKALWSEAIVKGAKRLCVCDTVGYANPHGVKALLSFIFDWLHSISRDDVLVDWHGHNDRGYAVINSITAVECGVDSVHVTSGGYGERVGNADMAQVMTNMNLDGYIKPDLLDIRPYAEHVAQMIGRRVPGDQPIVGCNAFATATGVHWAAVAKAERVGGTALADAVYSGVPASMVGSSQICLLGPMSGRSNVLGFLAQNLQVEDPDAAVVQLILETAQSADHFLSKGEVASIYEGFQK